MAIIKSAGIIGGRWCVWLWVKFAVDFEQEKEIQLLAFGQKPAIYGLV